MNISGYTILLYNIFILINEIDTPRVKTAQLAEKEQILENSYVSSGTKSAYWRDCGLFLLLHESSCSLRIWHFRENQHRLFTTQTFFADEVKQLQLSLLPWWSVYLVKTHSALLKQYSICIYTHISIHCSPGHLCVSHLYKQHTVNAASHTCGEYPITHKKGCLHSKNSPFPLLTPHDFLQISWFSNNASAITCPIVIDAFDGVRPHPIHRQVTRSRPRASIIWGEIAQTARTAAPVVYQSREEGKANKVSSESSSKIQMLWMLFISSKMNDWGRGGAGDLDWKWCSVT